MTGRGAAAGGALKSMTGFGRASRDVAGVSVAVEVRSVNHKGLDVKVRLPRQSGALEEQIGRRVRAALERGRVDVTVDVARTQAARSDEATARSP